MNYMFEEARTRLMFAGQSSKLQFYAPGDYWRLPYFKDPTEIWVLKLEQKCSFNISEMRGEGYVTFPSEGDIKAYCVLKDIEPVKRSSI